MELDILLDIQVLDKEIELAFEYLVRPVSIDVDIKSKIESRLKCTLTDSECPIVFVPNSVDLESPNISIIDFESKDRCINCIYRDNTKSKIEEFRQQDRLINRDGDSFYVYFWDTFYLIISKFRPISSIAQTYNDLMLKSSGLMRYLYIKDFMDNYSNNIIDAFLHSKSISSYSSLMNNFKRWNKFDQTFDVHKFRGYNLINGVFNVSKRKNTDISKIIDCLIVDYHRINSNIEDAGKLGFMLGCRLKLPSIIEVYKDSVDIEYICEFLDVSKIPRVRHKSGLTAEKIVRHLK